MGESGGRIAIDPGGMVLGGAHEVERLRCRKSWYLPGSAD